MALVWTRFTQKRLALLVSSTVTGPLILLIFLERMLWTKRIIHAQILIVFQKVNFSRRLPSSSVAIIATAKISRVAFTSAIDSSDALVTISRGQQALFINHSGPLHHEGSATKVGRVLSGPYMSPSDFRMCLYLPNSVTHTAVPWCCRASSTLLLAEIYPWLMSRLSRDSLPFVQTPTQALGSLVLSLIVSLLQPKAPD